MGAIAGDIIGSPYEWNNTDDMYFELCRSNRGTFHGREKTYHPRTTDTTVMTLAVARWLMRGKDMDEKALAREMISMRESFPKTEYSGTLRRWFEGEYHKPLNSTENDVAARVSPVGLYFDNLSDVMTYAERCAMVTHRHPDAIKASQAVAQAVWMARYGRSMDDIRFAMEHDFGYNLSRPADELTLLLKGCQAEPIVVNGVETGNLYYRETGKKDTSCELSVTAALTAFLASDGYESAVRRAVALGGDSGTIAAICGSIADPFYGGVPEKIEKLCSIHLDSSLKATMSSFEQVHDKKVVSTSKSEKPQDDAFTVIRVKGGSPTFVVASYRKELIQAIRDKFGDEVDIIKPSQMQSRINNLSKQPMDGTFLEYPRPDVRVLFYQNGQFRSGVTCDNPYAASLEDREAAFQLFNQLKEYAQEVKRELQSKCGYTGDGDIHFETACYPVIYHDRIEIREGDFLAGAITLNAIAGKIRIAEDGEMREGEYQDADWCRERVFPSSAMSLDEIKAAIGRFCLDDGVGIGRERRSNIDAANDDVAKSCDETLLASLQTGQSNTRSVGPKL